MAAKSSSAREPAASPGRLPGVRFVDKGRANLKGIAHPVRVMRAAPEDEQEQTRPWIVMFFGG